MQKITPFLWFDNTAEEAAKFYTTIFKRSKIGKIAHYDENGAKASGRPKGSVMTVHFKIRGQDFVALNGGPIFKFTPAISLFVHCKTDKDIDELYAKLTEGGEILMPLEKTPFSKKYAFIKDRFGVAWQLMHADDKDHITPCFLFVNKAFGKAEKAVQTYAKIFNDAKIDHILYYEGVEPGQSGTVKHSSFFLEGQEFMAMDGPGNHSFTFNESISFIINCEDQKEVDNYWKRLIKDGQEVQCGWLKDQFGISWQVVPTILEKLLDEKDPKRSQKVMKVMLSMKRLDIKELEKAYSDHSA